MTTAPTPPATSALASTPRSPAAPAAPACLVTPACPVTPAAPAAPRPPAPPARPVPPAPPAAPNRLGGPSQSRQAGPPGYAVRAGQARDDHGWAPGCAVPQVLSPGVDDRRHSGVSRVRRE